MLFFFLLLKEMFLMSAIYLPVCNSHLLLYLLLYSLVLIQNSCMKTYIWSNILKRINCFEKIIIEIFFLNLSDCFYYVNLSAFKFNANIG